MEPLKELSGTLSVYRTAFEAGHMHGTQNTVLGTICDLYLNHSLLEGGEDPETERLSNFPHSSQLVNN